MSWNNSIESPGDPTIMGSTFWPILTLKSIFLKQTSRSSDYISKNMNNLKMM